MCLSSLHLCDLIKWSQKVLNSWGCGFMLRVMWYVITQKDSDSVSKAIDSSPWVLGWADGNKQTKSRGDKSQEKIGDTENIIYMLKSLNLFICSLEKQCIFDKE